jgi:iron complex outermembrane recepter protein
MRLTNNELLKAVRLALYAGTTAVVGLSSAAVFAQDADTSSERLDTIVVTGSNIRRVDIETANPVITIDRAQIQKSGKLTVGDLVQELPSIAGNATNPQVNNGGGSGAASVSLRGLGSKRTLILIDGQRIINNDVNAIPANVVERIEVLLDGASAVYGSDAIGGVVNFIMRKDYQGAEFTADYGISDRDDGERKSVSITFGQSTDRGSVVAGVNYNKADAVSAGKRDFSSEALYLFYGSSFAGGSSRAPNGRITLPTSLRPQFNCASNSVIRLPGTTGASLSDYRCFVTSGDVNDFYNYQPLNVILVPQERTNLFAIGNYKLTDSVEAYMKAFVNRTSSSSLIAPYPFDARGNAVTISGDSLYNPFGEDLGFGTPYNVLERLTGVGQRVNQFDTQTSQFIAGLKGNIGDTSWRWDANVNYGHFTQDQYTTGYLNFTQLASALGPSMIAPVGTPNAGQPICVTTPGDAGTRIDGCVPLNIFEQDSAASTAQLRAAGSNPFQNFLATSREATVNLNGELFDLPAGPVSLAVGALYRKDYSSLKADSTIILNLATGTCDLGTACTTELQGNITTKEAYAEVFIPVLKDMPFAHSLNVDIGTRYSKFNLAGNTTNSKISIEWRPIEDLLLRGTVSEVFRAPNISELFAGAANNAPTVQDPCVGYLPGQQQGINACGPSTGATDIDPNTGIPPQQNGQISAIASGAVAAGFTLKPETGKSFDFGVVYDPSWIDGLSVSLDYYRIYLNDTITGVGSQNVLNICYQDPTSQFCPFINRFANGDINFVLEPTVNLGRLDTSGYDLGINYRLPEFDMFGHNVGRFTVGFNGTYISEFDNTPVPSNPDVPRISNAGVYTTQFGNFPRVRALGSLDWSMGAFEAGWRVRYIGNTRVGSADLSQGLSIDGGIPGTERNFGAYAYHSFTFGYTAEPINTQFQIGIDNAFDKQPPIYYQNNVTNANTDVRTFDTVGRYYWARATVKF